MKGHKPNDRLSTALIILLLVIGTGLFLYPAVGNMYNKRVSSVAAKHEEEAVQAMSEDGIREQMEKAMAYNRMVCSMGLMRVSGMEDDGYEDMLNLRGQGVMCSLEIPSIGVQVPVYHGTSEEVLQSAAGHYHGSSLPCGGPDSHAVITGHTGLARARLFTDLTRMQEGDMFFIKVLGEVHAYRVISVSVVLPDQVESLGVEPGRDLVTLVTCTPYGINTHRLLVTGERTAYSEPEGESAGLVPRWMYPEGFIILLTAVIILTAIVITMIIRRRYGKKD